MEEREQTIRRWFGMWLRGRDTGIAELFTKDAVYIESWGPEYRGAEKIRLWFAEWNTRGKVLTWDIRQYFHRDNQTVAEWFFRCRMSDGTEQAFDGLSLVKWENGKIAFLQEFGCSIGRYDPYADGPAPKFRQETAMWF
ncbi:MAG: nuclear transport factor 2 family protein [Oscillospiraceae bacterium]|nr:nuclear transport factor 2 family protein [Oscillospiraceae bacterium]